MVAHLEGMRGKGSGDLRSMLKVKKKWKQLSNVTFGAAEDINRTRDQNMELDLETSTPVTPGTKMRPLLRITGPRQGLRQVG